MPDLILSSQHREGQSEYFVVTVIVYFTSFCMRERKRETVIPNRVLKPGFTPSVSQPGSGLQVFLVQVYEPSM